MLPTCLCFIAYWLRITPTKERKNWAPEHVPAGPAEAYLLRAVGPSVDPATLLCIGHRGMGAESPDVPDVKRCPENTIYAFQKAAKLGVAMAELDVIPLRDSKDFVVYHNFNIIKKAGKNKRPCGCIKYEVDIFNSEWRVVFF